MENCAEQLVVCQVIDEVITIVIMCCLLRVISHLRAQG
jgi:hypothetical protein